MADYIKLFQTNSEYIQWEQSTEYLTPNVCKIEEDNSIKYNPEEENTINYLRFTSLEDSTISLTNKGSNTPNVEYSFDGINDWTTWDYSIISLPSGTTVYMKGNNPDGFSISSYDYSTFNMTGKIESHGNIMSLLYGDEFEDKVTIPVNYCYAYMFDGCSSLTTAPELPATTLADWCYRHMFKNCSSLTTAPELPATTLADHCYDRIFCDCSSLTTAPELPATILASGCYACMFQGCSSLTTAPELPATTLANNCYFSMFLGCSSLTTAPELPATTLTSTCYDSMFENCSSLNNITMLATDISAMFCLTDWVNGVSTNGTFTKASSMTSLPSGVNGIPEGWTVENA